MWYVVHRCMERYSLHHPVPAPRRSLVLAVRRHAHAVLLRAATGVGRRTSEQGADLLDQRLDLIGFIQNEVAMRA